MYSVDTIVIETKNNDSNHKLISLYLSGAYKGINSLSWLATLQFQWFNLQPILAPGGARVIITKNETFDPNFPEHLSDLVKLSKTRDWNIFAKILAREQ